MVVELVTNAMHIFKAFLQFKIHAEVSVSTILILFDKRLTSSHSSFEVINLLLGVLSESRSVDLETAAISGLLNTGSVEVDLNVVALVFVDSSLSLSRQFLEGLTHALEHRTSSKRSSEDLAH